MRLLKRDLETVFNECEMIAVLQNNATNAEDMLILKHRLRKHDITIKFFPNQVIPFFSKLQSVISVVVLFNVSQKFLLFFFLGDEILSSQQSVSKLTASVYWTNCVVC